MPAGTVFGKFSLNDSSFTGAPTAAKVYAKSSAEIVTLRQNFQQSSMFSGVSFQTVVETGSDIVGYPASVDMTFTLTKAATL